ncbi:MAG: NmrA family NAD(P)-binding protein, partial [Kofleriaceae bacterium]
MILVTGATGNIGGALVSMLLATGHEVRVLTRDAARVTASGVEIVIGDLEQPATLAPALAGIERAFFVF